MRRPVLSSHFPYVPISLEVHERIIDDLEALVDTGFDGHVIVPTGSLSNGHPPDGHLRWQLADGSTVLAPFYLGSVRIGALAPIPAVVTVLGDEPIIGRGVTNNFSATLDHGQRVLVGL